MSTCGMHGFSIFLPCPPACVVYLSIHPSPLSFLFTASPIVSMFGCSSLWVFSPDVCACVCVCVCVCGCVCAHVCVCACVCVCEGERERDAELKEGDRDGSSSKTKVHRF